ncbi:VOC family protein [Virgibacillus sp. C22-A2]|uniref:VOC family protein n=1 Tax=Virgibacillus tibetensis TaxID=3042313 RepID=A0ABU6KG44_9BACI|nr:VOC family protein [Virgibacillus sp. C22-A2]
MNIQKIGQIGVPVKDVERAIHFYRDLLGLKLLFNTDNMAFFQCNDIRLLLSLPEKEEFAKTSSVIYFQVDNIEESYDDLNQKGVPFTGEPHRIAKIKETETWMAFFKDSEDNTLALMSEVTDQD